MNEVCDHYVEAGSVKTRNHSLVKLIACGFMAGVAATFVSCSQQEFAGDAARVPAKKAPTTPTPTVDPPGQTAPPPGTIVDGGEIIGTPVERVGLGFEDWTDWDFNDVYLCFQGHFKVNNRDIVSDREQTVTVAWGTISAKLHHVTIKITEPNGSTSFTQSYTGVVRQKNLPPMSLPFKLGSKLNVLIDNPSLDHTSAQRAKVNLNWCNNTGN